VTQTGKGTCPKQKLLSRKCKDEKKSNEKKDKNKKKKKERKEREEKNRENKLQKKEGKKADKDKCSFGDWGAWGSCVKGNQQRIRKVDEGSERPSCQKKAVANRTCQV